MIGRLLRTRYEVLQALGEGPIFKAYSALDRVQGRNVCVRTLQAPFDSEPSFLEACKEPIERLNAVRHDGVERVFEMDEDDGHPFLVGELSSGTVLSERIKRLAPFSVPVSVAMAVSIGEALAALHREGIVHGDAGAHQVVVTAEGACRLQLAGIWKAYSASQTAGVVVLPSMAGYLAPEISQGSMPTAASDVYSLGVILFQLLTGRLPFLAEQPMALIMKHVNEAPPPLKSLNASVPVALEECVRKSLAKDPADRYPNAEAMLADLRMVQDALRFGKSAPWPPKEGAVAPQEPVAPQLEGIRSETKSKFFQRKDTLVEEDDGEEDVPGDVPLWLRMALVFFVSLVVFMVAGWMIFNLSKPRTIKVPSLQGLTMAQADENLKHLNLKLHVMRREASEQPAGTILDTDPSAGRDVVEGQAVGVVVSSGSRTVEVPDVRGLTPDRAREVLDSVGLNLNARIEEVRDRSAELGTIVSQLPEPRTRVDRGASVRIRVASEERSEPDRDADRRYVYTIRIQLNDIDSPVVVRVDMTDSRSTETIHEEEHLAGDDFTITAEGYGLQADFRIFYDGSLVKTVTKNADEGGRP